MVQFCYSILHLGTETDSKCLLKRWVRKKKFTNNIGKSTNQLNDTWRVPPAIEFIMQIKFLFKALNKIRDIRKVRRL